MLWGVKASCAPWKGLWGLPKAVSAPPPSPSRFLPPLPSPPFSSTSLGGPLPEPGAFPGAVPPHTGFMFQVSRTWLRQPGAQAAV